MVERRTPQARINTRALEIAAEVKGELAGHKDTDGLQFANLHLEITELKADLKEQGEKQEGYHRDNKTDLGNLKAAFNDLATKVAVGQGKQDGAGGLTATFLKILPIVMSAATLAFLIWGHRT